MKIQKQVMFVLAFQLLSISCGKSDKNADHSQADTVTQPRIGIDFSESLYGNVNLDKNSQKTADFNRSPSEGENDLRDWSLPSEQLEKLDETDRLVVKLSAALTDLRVYFANKVILGADADQSYTVEDLSQLSFQFEFGEFNLNAELIFEQYDTDDKLIGEGKLTLATAPLIMNHHLQPSEHVYALEITGNEALINAYKTVLGDLFTPLSSVTYEDDVWVQDEIEFATSINPDGERQDIIIDSIRDRGLRPLAGNIANPDTIVRTWGKVNQATTFDSFGNLEATPPLEVDGVNYPFGRIYYGANGKKAESLNSTLADFLDSQTIQKPFAIDTSWLCVGHVDEFSTFVPDSSSPKGFKLLLADVNEAYRLLATLPPETALPKYSQDFNYATVGAILNDEALKVLNDNLQKNTLDSIAETFKTELGLDDSDIIRVPSIFEDELCGDGLHGALVPGMANLIIANDSSGATNLFIPDPFMRATEADQTPDPFIQYLSEQLPDDLNLHFVDDWTTYHMGMGEIHCGTNVRRTPIANWWETDNLLTQKPE